MDHITWSDYNNCLNQILCQNLPTKVKCPQPWEICTDSRENLEKKWFLPLVGETFDGHSFIEEALSKKKALGVFCSEAFSQNLPKKFKEKSIIVTDTYLCLQKIAQMNRRKNEHVKVFAVTGSVGKTTCKNMLASIIEQTKKEFLYAEKNYNNEFGLPFTLLKIRPEHQFAILEMGARRLGNIKSLVEIAEPNFVACLNVGHSHIEIFGSRDNIYLTKTEIFEKTQFYQKGIVNGDDPKLLNIAKNIDSKCLSFGFNQENNAQVIKIENKEQETHLTLRIFESIFTAKIKSFHEAYAINALAASLLAYLAELDIRTIQEGLSNFTPPASRFQTFHHKNKIIIDDSYNASPESIKAGIQTVNKLYPEKKISYILGDMLEFGEESQVFHNELGGLCAASTSVHNLLTVGEKSQHTQSSAVAKGLKQEQTEHFISVEKLIEKNFSLSDFGDVIYIKGSSGVKLASYLKHLLEK